MQHLIIRSISFFAALLLSLNLALAADVTVKVPDVPGAAKAGSDSLKAGAKSTVDSTKAGAKNAVTNAKTAVKGKVVDINTATAAELQAIPGITDAYASKIIAGRPYVNKTQLKSRNILPVPVYDHVKDLVIAKQPAKETPAKKK